MTTQAHDPLYLVERKRRLKRYFAGVAAVYLLLGGLYGLASAWAEYACRRHGGPFGPESVVVDGGVYYSSKESPLTASDTISLLAYSAVPYVETETNTPNRAYTSAWLSYGVRTKYLSYHLSSAGDPDCEMFYRWRSGGGGGVYSSHRASQEERNFVGAGLPADACIARTPLDKPSARYSVLPTVQRYGTILWDKMQLTDTRDDEVIGGYRWFHYCIAGTLHKTPPTCTLGDLFARTCHRSTDVSSNIDSQRSSVSTLLKRLRSRSTGRPNTRK